MKSTQEIINYIETELKIIALEDLNVKDNDTAREIKYKTTQLGKHVALEKLLAYINNPNSTLLSNKKRSYAPNNKAFKEEKQNQPQNKISSDEKRRPIVVCK